MSEWDYMNFLVKEPELNRQLAKNEAVCAYASWIAGNNDKANTVLEICAEYAFSLDEIAKWGRWLREQAV